MAVSPTFLRRGLASLAIVGALVAAPALALAGTNDGPSVAPASVLGSGVSAAAASDVHVAVFFDDNYVDTATDGGGEAYNLQQTLISQGFTVTTFVGTTTAEWTAALAGQQVVAIPELEHDDSLGDDLEPGALTALQAFVNGGGQLMSFNDRNFPFLETVLDLSSGTLEGNQNCPCTKAATAGAEFASAPDTLDSLSATGTLDIFTAPSGSSVAYADDDNDDEAGVAIIPMGTGRIVYFGWDWFFGEGSEDTTWFGVLDAAVLSSQPAPPVTPPTTPPTTPTTPVTPEPVAAAPRFTG